MDTTEIVVTLAGLALSGFVVWYFFFPARPSANPPAALARTQAKAIRPEQNEKPKT